MQSSERLLLDRRRRGLTQRQAAKRYKTSTKRYREWEAGESEMPAKFKSAVPAQAEALPLHEQCVIARTRAGWNMQTLIRRSGLSRYWIHLSEHGRGNPETLAKFWLGQNQ